MNDLAKSVLNERHRVAPLPTPTKSYKRRKIAPLTLPELFDGSFSPLGTVVAARLIHSNFRRNDAHVPANPPLLPTSLAHLAAFASPLLLLAAHTRFYFIPHLHPHAPDTVRDWRRVRVWN